MMVKCDNCGKYAKKEYHIVITTYGNKLFCDECFWTISKIKRKEADRK